MIKPDIIQAKIDLLEKADQTSLSLAVCDILGDLLSLITSKEPMGFKGVEK